MAQPRVSCVVYLLIVIAHLSSCARHDNYSECKFEPDILENEKICHPLNMKHTHSMHNGTAAIVTSHHMFEHWHVKVDRNCTFTFKTEKGEGLFAVIHKMFFRRRGNECLDFVRFKRTDGHRTEKFCGQIDRSQTIYSSESEDSLHNIYDSLPSHNHDMYAEFDPIERWIGSILTSTTFETEIFISKEKLSGDSLNLTIVYTPYRSCNRVDLGQYKEVGHNICIRKEFLCDKIYNCPLGICLDEVNCTYSSDRFPKDDTATKVTVGAVTTMILCFIIFVMCLWICKKSKKFCWSSDCAGPNVCSRPSSLRDVENGPGSNRGVPTAPMLEVAVSSPVADKDLPPSYDSLFPEQSNTARS